MYPFRLVISLLLLLSLCHCRTTETYYKIAIHMNPAVENQLTPDGDAVMIDKEGLWGAIRPVTYEELSLPVSLYSDWDFEDPFEGIFDEKMMPIVFYLLLENRSETPIIFNPSVSFSVFYEREPLFTIEYDDFYQDLYDVRGSDEQLKKIKKLLIRSYQTLNPGEQARGLLFFKRPDEEKRKPKELLFQIRRVFVEKREITIAVPFQLQMEKVEISENEKVKPSSSFFSDF